MYRKSYKKQSSDKMLLALALICVGALIAAYILEHVFGVLPCQMCIYERNVFMAAATFTFLSFFLIPVRFHSLALFLAGFVFTGGFLLAAYHVAVQQHWVSLPAFCMSNNFSDLNSVEALREQMLKTPLVRCDQVTWSLFGFSLAAYNAMLSFVLAIACWIWAGKKK